ncbi:MAG: BglII/BstYI family type II restriction endonuclease [bacterium]
MKAETTFFHCGDQLRETLSAEIGKVLAAVDAVKWGRSFVHDAGDARYEYQTGYNRAFGTEFSGMGWESQPVLRTQPKLIGDFRKGLAFVEIQFGNSATLYRDYYKFQYGLANGLLSLAVLVVPTKPAAFFPSRPDSVNNMADYALASTCLSVLPLNVPTMLVGLLPEN